MTERIAHLAKQIQDVQTMQGVDDIMKKMMVFKLIQEARLTAHGYIVLEELLKKDDDGRKEQ